MRIKPIFSVVTVVLAVALAGCGGGSSSGDKATKAAVGKPNSPEVKKLIEQTFGPNDHATSGNISGVVDITVKGLPRYKEPIQVSVVGPFSQSGSSPAEAMFDVSLGLRGGILGGDVYFKGDKALIGLGSTAYQVPDPIAIPFRKPLQNTGNALTAVLGVFHIAPQRWAKNPRIVGNERVAGIDTIHGTAELDTKAVFLDLAALAKRLTSLKITNITGLPRAVDRQARQALQRSVKSASGDVYTGAKDHVLRKAKFNLLLEPSAKDRKILGGFTSIKVVGNLDVSDVGSPQTIKVPANRGSYSALQVSLDALAEAVR
ncbi:MAG TPA: hypothetical protein VL120_01200 [Solirubrobacteraceae bacterium]|nr:hypothetical protein [Solirubrobacteraceae bacterium]